MNINKKFFSKIGFNYLALAIIALAAEIIMFNLLNIINPNYLNNLNLISSLTSICNYIIPLPLFYGLMKKIEITKLEKSKLNTKTFIIFLGISLTLMWIGNILGLTTTSLLSRITHNDITNPVQQLISSIDIWLNFFIISIIAPIFEEIIFRKIIIDRTIKYGVKVSILMSAIIFALFHGNLNQFFYTFLIGGFFAYVYVKTGNIIYSIILHMAVNLMGSVVSLTVAQSFINLQLSFNIFDVSIIIIYLIILILSFCIGLASLFKFRDKLFIKLEIPYKTVFLNYGMICFIAFYIFEMIYQVLG